MKKINRFVIDIQKNDDIENIIKKIISLLPKQLYIKQEICYYFNNKKNNKTTIILNTFNNSDIIIIKMYKNKYNTTPDELNYLSKYYKNHYFYENCYLAMFTSDNMIFSIVKCKKADGDIDNITLNIKDYNTMNMMISDELLKMHSSGYVHMDIKTTNILYKKIDGKIKFGLCDFELAHKDVVYLSPKFRTYYYGLYNFYIPLIYTNDFELKIFNRLLQYIRINKNIKLHTI
jgi:serine/threonine protein kinase